MSLPYRITAAPALRRPLLVQPPSRILLRERSTKSGDLASRLVADNISRGNSLSKTSQEETLVYQQKRSVEYALKTGMNPLIPTTFVSLPLSELPSSMNDKASYLWFRFRAWLSTMGVILGTKTDSMVGWTRPRFKAKLSSIPPTGKIMYRELLEAFAAGDKPTIRKVCTPHLAGQYINAVDKRKQNEELRWELVKYSGSPSLKSYLIMPMNPQEKDIMTEQAVVSITSTQRVSKINKTNGTVIPGSKKEQESTEYVVLKREYSKRTWAPMNDWQIWGTTPPTTLKKIRDDMKMIQDRQLEMAGWKTANKKTQ